MEQDNLGGTSLPRQRQGTSEAGRARHASKDLGKVDAFLAVGNPWRDLCTQKTDSDSHFNFFFFLTVSVNCLSEN